jgi:hypothetical protein
MRDEVGVHLPDLVVRTHEVEERFAAQVAHVEESKFPVAYEDAGRTRIFLTSSRA